MEKILMINSIKVNCIEPITSKYICLTAFSENGVENGVYLNLFYNKISEIEYDSEKYIEEAKETIKDFLANFSVPLNHSDAINQIKTISEITVFRIININKFKNEFLSKGHDIRRFSNFKQQGISLYVKIKDDNNSFYISFIYGYLMNLIDKLALNSFVDFLNFMKNANNAYSFKKKCKEETSLVIEIIEEIIKIQQKTGKNEFAYSALFFYFNLFPPFLQALIKTFKEMTYKFLKARLDCENDGKKLKDLILKMQCNYDEFIKSKFRIYESPIQKEFMFVLQIFMNIKLKIISLEENDLMSLFPNEVSCKLDEFNCELLKVPNSSNSTIYLLTWKDHYDLLLPEGVKSFMDFKKFSTKNLKPFGILFENKNVNGQLSYS